MDALTTFLEKLKYGDLSGQVFHLKVTVEDLLSLMSELTTRFYGLKADIFSASKDILADEKVMPVKIRCKKYF